MRRGRRLGTVPRWRLVRQAVNDVLQDAFDTCAVVGMRGVLADVAGADVDEQAVGVDLYICADDGGIVAIGKDNVAMCFHNYSKLCYGRRLALSVVVLQNQTTACGVGSRGRYVP